MLNRFGKTAVLCSPGPFTRPETKEIEHLFARSIADAAKKAGHPAEAAVIIVDCSTPERISPEFTEEIRTLPTAVIDHHASGQSFGDVSFVNGSSPSTTILIYQLFKELGVVPTADEAEDLLFGFLTDTGYFRHLDSSNADSLQLAAELLNYGASLKDLYYRMYGGRQLESKILTGLVLSRALALFGGKCISIYETLEEKNTFGPENRDSDTIYSQLLSVKGCRAVIFIREETDIICSVSLRSLDDIDVGEIAATFGGGGHKRAAGFEWKGSRSDISVKLQEAFGEVFKGR
jgi:phosphoesterase RecJ-like protein